MPLPARGDAAVPPRSSPSASAPPCLGRARTTSRTRPAFPLSAAWLRLVRALLVDYSAWAGTAAVDLVAYVVSMVSPAVAHHPAHPAGTCNLQPSVQDGRYVTPRWLCRQADAVVPGVGARLCNSSFLVARMGRTDPQPYLVYNCK